MLDVDGNLDICRKLRQSGRSAGHQHRNDRHELADGVLGQRTPPSRPRSTTVSMGVGAAADRTRSPDLGQPKGLKGRASKFAKRVVRKLTHWYVEPRSGGLIRQNLDLQNAELASSVLAELQLHNARFELQAASLTEQLERLERSRWQASDGFAMQADVQLLRRRWPSCWRRVWAWPQRLGCTSTTRAFEERFRGPSDGTSRSQEHYLTKLSSAGDRRTGR